MITQEISNRTGRLLSDLVEIGDVDRNGRQNVAIATFTWSDNDIDAFDTVMRLHNLIFWSLI